MTSKRVVFFISDNTATSVQYLGYSLLEQFTDIEFQFFTFSFINSIEIAQNVLGKIMDIAQHEQDRVIVFSSIFNMEICRLFDYHDRIYHIDFINRIIPYLQNELLNPSA